jgi:transposase
MIGQLCRLAFTNDQSRYVCEWIQRCRSLPKWGATAATFPSAGALSSRVGACPGDEETAGVNHSHRSPKGNRHKRRLLNQTANCAVKQKGSIFQILYRRYAPRMGHKQAIGVIGDRLGR